MSKKRKLLKQKHNLKSDWSNFKNILKTFIILNIIKNLDILFEVHKKKIENVSLQALKTKNGRILNHMITEGNKV